MESTGQEEDFGESFGYGANYTLSGRANNTDLLASLGYRNSGINYHANGRIVGFDNAQGDTMDADTFNAFIYMWWKKAGAAVNVRPWKAYWPNSYIDASSR